MSRKKVISKKKFYETYKVSDNIDTKVDNLTHTELVDMAGGSISNLPVNNAYFSQWMTVQNTKNIFIGKQYIKPATEYSTSDIEIDKISELSGIEAEHFLSGELNKLIDPELSKSIISDYMGTSLLCDDDHDSKFIDCSIVENVTNHMLDSNKDEIVAQSINEIKKYHDDETYNILIDIDKMIDISKKLIIEYKEKK